MAFTGPALGLVGPARLAPEFAPYVVMVLDSSGGGEASYCSASVIAPDVVLTAAHCVSGPSETRVFFRSADGKPVFLIAAWIAWVLAAMLLVPLAVRFARVRTHAAIQAGLSLVIFGSALAYYLWPGPSARLVFVDVARIAINPGYRPSLGAPEQPSIDLALLRLAKPLPAEFRPVELAEPPQLGTGQPLRIVGFGIADEVERGVPGILRTGVLAATGTESPTYVKLIDPNGTGLGGCTGDSGAPVFEVGEHALVAVAIRAKGSGGYSCGAVTEAVLAGPQLPWIRKIVQGWGATASMTL